MRFEIEDIQYQQLLTRAIAIDAGLSNRAATVNMNADLAGRVAKTVSCGDLNVCHA
jgi:hypothetical protein